MVPPAPDAWASGPIAAHSNRVSADCGLRCRETGFPGRRKMRRHVARPTDQRSQRPSGCTRRPPIRGLCNQLREYSANGELRGGPGRTRTSNETVMSAPMWRHAYFDFTEFLDGTAVLTNEIANDWRRSFPAIASTALRMCAGW